MEVFFKNAKQTEQMVSGRQILCKNYHKILFSSLIKAHLESCFAVHKIATKKSTISTARKMEVFLKLNFKIGYGLIYIFRVSFRNFCLWGQKCYFLLGQAAAQVFKREAKRVTFPNIKTLLSNSYGFSYVYLQL